MPRSHTEKDVGKMKRARKPKGNGGQKLTKKQKNELTHYVVRQLFPQYAGLLLTAVQYELGANTEQLERVIVRVNRYTAANEAGLLSVDDIRRNFEEATGIKLADVWGNASMYDEALGKGGAD